MITREALQEAQYKIFGPYHRRRFSWPFALGRLRYGLALSLFPENLKGLAVLDYGGGDGAMATLLADKEAFVAVVDSSQTALRFAQSSDFRLKVVQAKTDLPIKNGSFNLVTLLETIEHIDDASETRALAEASRILKPDGSAIISVPSSNRSVRRKHYRHYSYGDLVKKCEKVGLTPQQVIFYRQPQSNFLNRILAELVGLAVYGVDWWSSELQRQRDNSLTTEQKADGIVISTTKTKEP